MEKKLLKILIIIFPLSEVLILSPLQIFPEINLLIQILILLSILFFSIEKGILLYSVILLTSFGSWVYVLEDSNYNQNLYQIKIIGVSLVSLVSILLATKVVFFKKQKIKNKYLYIYIILIIITFSTFVNGLFNDYIFLIYDLKIYLPFLVNVFLFSNLKYKYINIIFKYALRLSFCQILLSLLVNARFNYSEFLSFIPMSNIGVIFIFLSLSRLINISKLERISYVTFWLILSIIGLNFVNGKILLISLIFSIFLLFRNIKYSLYLLIPMLLFFIIVNNNDLVGNEKLIEDVYLNNIIYKMFQVTDILFSQNIMSAIGITSFSNIVVEFMTIIKSFLEEPHRLLIGAGLGGGVKDYYELLHMWTWNGGYAYDFYLNNYYVRMHLSIFDYMIKFGPLITLYLIYKIYKKLLIEFYTLFTFFVMLLVYSSVSKEMFAITVLLFYLQAKKTS